MLLKNVIGLFSEFTLLSVSQLSFLKNFDEINLHTKSCVHLIEDDTIMIIIERFVRRILPYFPQAAFSPSVWISKLKLGWEAKQTKHSDIISHFPHKNPISPQNEKNRVQTRIMNF